MKKIILICLYIILCSSIVYAETKRQQFIFLPSAERSFQGLNTSISPLILDPMACTVATNVLYGQAGTRKKRGGITYLNETSLAESSGSNTVMGIFDFKSINSLGIETRKAVTHSDGKIFKMDTFDGTWDRISSGPFTVDKQVDYAAFRQIDTTADTLIMTNGAEAPQTWQQSDTVTNNITGGPSGVDFYPSVIETHKYRLWAAGVPSYPYRVFFSAAYKWNDWYTASDAGYVDIIDPQGGKIIALVGNYYDYLVVFTEYSVGVITGSSYSDFAYKPLITGIGAINQASIIPYGNDIFFVSQKGIHSIATTEKYGDIRETYLSAAIQDDFDDLNKNKLSMCCGSVYPELNYFIWSFTSGGSQTNNICFVYDYIGNRWSKWTNINASCFGIIKDTTKKDILCAGNYDGFVNKLNQSAFSDNGTAITMTVTTPYINFGDPLINKGFKQLFVFLEPQGTNNLTARYTIENLPSNSLTISQAGESAVFGSFIIGTDRFGSGSLIPRTKTLVGSGKTIQITFIQDTLNVGCTIYGFGIQLIPEQIDYSY
jgi:hypothetical protein